MKRVLLGGLVLLASCEPGGLLGTSARKVKSPLNVPYIVGDPVPNPPVRAAFARTPWVAVNAAVLRVTGHYIDAAENHVVFESLRRQLWGKSRYRNAAPTDVDPADLEALRLAPPATHVWLFGPEGPCKATVGRPSAHLSSRGDIIEIDYALDGCPEAQWAPVGSLADSMPNDVRWVQYQDVAQLDLAPSQTWNHPWASAAAWPDETEREADEVVVVARAIPGVDPTPAQTLITAVWRHPDDDCLDVERTEAAHLRIRGSAVERQEPLAGVQPIAELLGAVVQGKSAEALVYFDGIDHHVAVPPAAPEDRPDLPAEVDRGPSTWTVVTTDGGPRTEQDVEFSRYQVLPPCQGS